MGISKKPWPILSVCGFKSRIDTILRSYPFSPDSVKNPYGAGNPCSSSSPTNHYGRGLQIEGR